MTGKEFAQAFVEWAAAEAERRGMSQSRLARAVPSFGDAADATWRKVRAGKRELKLHEAFHLAAALSLAFGQAAIVAESLGQSSISPINIPGKNGSRPSCDSLEGNNPESSKPKSRRGPQPKLRGSESEPQTPSYRRKAANGV